MKIRLPILLLCSLIVLRLNQIAAQGCPDHLIYKITQFSCNNGIADINFTLKTSSQVYQSFGYDNLNSSVGTFSTQCPLEYCYYPGGSCPTQNTDVCGCNGVTYCEPGCPDMFGISILHSGYCKGTEEIGFTLLGVPSGQSAYLNLTFTYEDVNLNYQICNYEVVLPPLYCANQAVCTGDPLTFSWLQTIFNNANCTSCPIEIYKRKYLGQDVIEVRRISPCSNQGGDIYDCGGNLLFKYTSTLNQDQLQFLSAPTKIWDCSQQTACSLSGTLNANLINRYPFDGNANDAAGSNNGTAYGGLSYAADHSGAAGKAAAFDGSNDSVTTANPIAERSVTFWFRAGIAEQMPVFQGGSMNNQTGAGYFIGTYRPNGIPGVSWDTTYGLVVDFINRGVYIPFDEISSGWHHIAVSWDGVSPEIRVGIDGKFPKGYLYNADTGGFAGPPGEQPFSMDVVPNPNSSVKTRFGVNFGSRLWNTGLSKMQGRLDEVRIYSRALTEDEVRLLAEVYALAQPEDICDTQTVTLNCLIANANSYEWRNLNTGSIISTNAQTTVSVGQTTEFTCKAQVGACTFRDTITVSLLPNGPLTCVPEMLLPADGASDVPVTTAISWAPGGGCPDGYQLSLGTSPGGTNIFNGNVGNITTYQPTQNLPAGTTIYVKIRPLRILYLDLDGDGTYETVINQNDIPTGCQQFQFTTAGSNAPCLTPGTPTLTKTGHTFLDLVWNDSIPGAGYAYQIRWREAGSTTWQTNTLGPYAPSDFCYDIFPIVDPPSAIRLQDLKPCTAYEAQVRKICNFQQPDEYFTAWSATASFSTLECGNLYFTAACSPAARESNRIALSQFGLGAMSDTTGHCYNCGGCWNNGDGYLYQSAMPVSLQPGQTYNLSYTIETGTLLTSGTIRVWLDMNRDLDFNDTGELIHSQSVTAGSPQSVMVTIPANATVGVSRLRIIFRTDTGPDPCSDFDAGAVRDYPVYMGIAGCNPLTVSASSNTPVCHGDTLQFQINAPTAVAWQWYGPNNFKSSEANPKILNAKSLNSGTYTVVAMDNLGCTGTATTTVEVRPAIVVTMLDNGYPSGAFRVEGGGGSAYPLINMELANFPNILGTLTGAPFSPGDTVFYEVPAQGTYQITVADNLGCSALKTVFISSGSNSSPLPSPCPYNDFPASDLCDDICIYCNFNGYTGSTSGYTGQTPSGFCGTIENEQWFGFIAGAGAATFTATPANCAHENGIQIALYTSCNGMPLACNGGSTGGGSVPVGITVPLTPGVNYFLLIDGYAGDQCDFTLTVDPPAAVQSPTVGNTGTLSGPATACPGAVVTYQIPPVTGAGVYEWNAPGDWLINGQSPPVLIPAPGGNIVQAVVGYGSGDKQICVRPANSCNDGNAVCKTVNVQSIAPTILPPVTVCAENVPYTLPWGYEVNNSGIYQETYISYQGCDSVVQQTVTVKSPILKSLPPQVICAGECVTVCGEQFCDAGNYFITCQSYQGCDSTVNFFVIILEPVAEIIPNPGTVLVCDTPSVTLGSAATPGTKVWKNLQGQVLGTGNSLTVTQAGAYVLTVTAAAGGKFCIVNDTTVISGNGTPQCSTSLLNPVHQSINVPVQASLSWTAATPCVDGYRLTLSTTPGGNDLLNNVDVGNVTSYQPAMPLPEDTIYVRIVPYNDQLAATGCQEYWFVTKSCPAPTQANFSFVVSGLTVTFNNASVNGTAYEWDFGDGSTSILPNPVYTYSQAGIYTVTLLVQGTCDAAMLTLVLNTAPMADFSATPTAGCSPLTVQFSNVSSSNTTSFQWQFPGGMPASSTLQNPVVLYGSPGTYTVTLIAINPIGRDTLSIPQLLTVSPEPTAGFNSAINGTTVSFTNTSANATTYSWNFGDGSTSTQANPSHTYSALGTYMVCLTVTGNCGNDEICKTMVIDSAIIQCPDPNWTNFISNDCGDLQASGGPAPGEPIVYCEGQTVRVENNASPAAAIQTTYIDWGDGTCEVFAGSPALLTHVYDVPDTCLNFSNGRMTFQVRMGHWLFCANGLYSFNFVTLFIPVQANPISKFSLEPGNACPEQPVQFTNQSCTNDANATYFWDFGDGATSALDPPPAHIYGNPGTYEVKLQVTNNCATSTYIQNITVGNAPSAVATVKANTCTGQAVGSVSASAIGGVLPYQFLWNTGSSSKDLSGLTAGTYTVTVTDAVGCTASASATVTNLDGPMVSATTSSTTCGLANGRIDLTVEDGTTPYIYLWSNGSTGEDMLDIPAGTYTVTVTDAAGCTTVTTSEVGESSPLETQNTTEICLPDNTAYTVSLSLSGGNPPYILISGSGDINGGQFSSQPIPAGTPYTFTFTDSAGCDTLEISGGKNCDCAGIVDTVNIDTLICAGTIFRFGDLEYDEAGHYMDTIFSPSGCDSLLILDLKIRKPDITITGDDHICRGESSILNLQSNSCTGCFFQWSDPTLSGPWGEVSPLVTITYAVTATDQLGCTATDSLTVRVQDSVTVHLDSVVCLGGSATVCGQIFTKKGDYKIQCPCDSTVFLTLDVVSDLRVEAFPDTFNLRSNQDEGFFEVAFNDILSANSAWTLEILRDGEHGRATSEPDGRVRYRLDKGDFYGIDSFLYRICNKACPDTCDVAPVIVYVQNKIPNAFSPNDDGYNDTFDPYGWHLENDRPNPVPTSAVLTVWNRWNEVVFHADPYPNKGWDGTSATGKRVPAGAYYYTLQMTGGETELIRGVVHVLVK